MLRLFIFKPLFFFSNVYIWGYKYPSNHGFSCIPCLVSLISLSLICKYYLIFIVISSLTHDCLISKHMGLFQLSFSLLNSSLMSLLSENTLCMISIRWNLLSCLMTQTMGNVDKYFLCPWKKWVFHICQVNCFIIRSGLLINFVQTIS